MQSGRFSREQPETGESLVCSAFHKDGFNWGCYSSHVSLAVRLDRVKSRAVRIPDRQETSAAERPVQNNSPHTACNDKPKGCKHRGWFSLRPHDAGFLDARIAVTVIRSPMRERKAGVHAPDRVVQCEHVEETGHAAKENSSGACERELGLGPSRVRFVDRQRHG